MWTSPVSLKLGHDPEDTLHQRATEPQVEVFHSDGTRQPTGRTHCWFVKTLWILNDAWGAKPGHSSEIPATTEAMKVPWPKVSDKVLSEVQFILSSGVFGKWGWFCRRPVSKMATVAFCPFSPWFQAAKASLPGATMTLYLACACVRFLHRGVSVLRSSYTLRCRRARRAPRVKCNARKSVRWRRRPLIDTQCRPSGPSFLATVARCFSLDA